MLSFSSFLCLVGTDCTQSEVSRHGCWLRGGRFPSSLLHAQRSCQHPYIWCVKSHMVCCSAAGKTQSGPAAGAEVAITQCTLLTALLAAAGLPRASCERRAATSDARESRLLRRAVTSADAASACCRALTAVEAVRCRRSATASTSSPAETAINAFLPGAMQSI